MIILLPPASAVNGIYSGSSGQILEVAGWAHGRRYWWEARTTDPARAPQVLGAIARLYQIETACAALTAAQRGSSGSGWRCRSCDNNDSGR